MTMPTSAAESSKKTARSVGSDVWSRKRARLTSADRAPRRTSRRACRKEMPSSTNAAPMTTYAQR